MYFGSMRLRVCVYMCVHGPNGVAVKYGHLVERTRLFNIGPLKYRTNGCAFRKLVSPANCTSNL